MQSSNGETQKQIKNKGFYFIKDTLYLDSRNQRVDSIQIGFPVAEKWSINLSNQLLSKLHYELNYLVNQSDGDYFSNNLITYLFRVQKNQWIKVKSLQQHLTSELAYYNKEIAVTFKLKGIYSRSKFANLINDGTVRNNLSTTQMMTLSAKSGYIKSFNFYQAFTIEQSDFQNQFTNFRNTLFKNEMQLYFTKKRVNSFLQLNSYQFYSKGPFLHFLDAGFDLKSKYKSLTYSINLHNLFDIRERNFYLVNDFSRSEFKNNLVGRTLLVGILFSL